MNLFNKQYLDLIEEILDKGEDGNNIRLLEIKYNEHIENKLKEILNEFMG